MGGGALGHDVDAVRPMMVVEFSTRAEAEAALATVNALAADYWRGQGFTVVGGAEGPRLVGRRQSTMADVTRAQTRTWDVVRASPDGTFYIRSLAGTPWAAAMEAVRAAHPGMVERARPGHWVEGE